MYTLSIKNIIENLMYTYGKGHQLKSYFYLFIYIDSFKELDNISTT